MAFLTSLLFIALTTLLLVRKVNAQSVLFVAGILMWVAAFAFGEPAGDSPASDEPARPLPAAGMLLQGLLDHLKATFAEIMGGLGLMIMVIGGFVKYMDHCGASLKLVEVALKPLRPFRRNPYLLASLTLPVGQVLFMAIPSAAGFALLWMSAVFPILTRMGVGPVSAAAVITATTAFGVGPACATTASAMSVLSLEAVPYFLQDQLPLVWPLGIVMAVLFYFWNRRQDRSLKPAASLPQDDPGANPTPSQPEAEPVSKEPGRVPTFYALLPLLPIIMLLLFSPWINPLARGLDIDTTQVMLLSFLLAFVCELIVHRAPRRVLSDISVFWKGMAEMLVGVVSLVIAADFFADGLIRLGFIEELVQLGGLVGLQAGGIGVLLTLMIFGAAVLMGSGNAAFFAFGPLVPGISEGLSCSGSYLLLPMQLAASMGRTLSPVSGVLIAVAAPARITPLDIARRNLLPLLGTLLIMLLLHFVF